jgi:hypothetical protein
MEKTLVFAGKMLTINGVAMEATTDTRQHNTVCSKQKKEAEKCASRTQGLEGVARDKKHKRVT